MTYLAVVLHVFGVQAMHRLERVRPDLSVEESDRGSESIEKVLWAVAVIAIVGIVVTVIRNFVTSESAKIQ